MKPQIYVNLRWGYEKYELKGTTERNNAQPFLGCPTCVFEKMHACVQMCEDLHCDLGDGGDDAGNDADAGSGGGGDDDDSHDDSGHCLGEIND